MSNNSMISRLNPLSKSNLPERVENDFYPTKPILTDAAIEWLVQTHRSGLTSAKDLHVLDPGAGCGPWGNSIKKFIPDCYLIGVELDEDMPASDAYDEWIVGDFMDTQLPNFDLIIGNPPYEIIHDFIIKAWSHLDRRGTMLLLTRVEMINSQWRHQWLWPVIQPHYIIPLPERPSFTEDGKTNANDYILMIFDKWYTSLPLLLFNWWYDRGPSMRLDHKRYLKEKYQHFSVPALEQLHESKRV